jgi:endonuclease/exonuclease/phosphatase family metal-dependent hydrolase
MRLATFNILNGRSTVDDQVDIDRFAAAVTALDADVLGLQEVDRHQPRSHLSDLTAVAAEAMGAVAHRFAPALSGTPGGSWTAATKGEVPGAASYGIALLSRYPVRSWRNLRLPRIGFRFPLYLPDQRKVVLADEEPRAALIAQLETPTGPLVVANTHLSFLPGWGQVQLWRIRRHLAASSEPTIVMGDLNLEAPWPTRITGFSSLAAHPTMPWDEPSRQLDHILGRGIVDEVVASRAVRLPLSDHRALVVDLAVPGPGDPRRGLPTGR